MIPNPWPEGELVAFLEHFLYSPEVFFLTGVTSASDGRIEAVCDTTQHFPLASHQRGDPKKHPPHVSAPELLMMTGSLGCLSAYFFHGCKWQEGWVGFGSRIHRADYRDIAHLGPELTLVSEETKTRVGARRVVLRFAFEFSQGGRVVYRGDQTAMFVRDPDFG